MGWHSVAVVLGFGILFCCGGAGLWDVVILRGAGLRDGIW